MKLRTLLAATAVAATTLGSAFAANASLVFVGAWQVDQGPSWYGTPPNGPLAYTGQEAAALLFGGAASDYSVSTLGSDVNTINFSAWYSVIGVGNAAVLAQDHFKKYLGQYYGPTADYICCGDAYVNTNAASAFVDDNAQGSLYMNYAFRDDAGVPEPATWGLMITGLGLAGVTLRSRRRMAVATPDPTT